MATARDLGHWARISPSNESIFATQCHLHGIEGLLTLSLQHCGLTLERIRDLYLLRMSIINPITDIIDKCVGHQWYSSPNFWNGGVSDAYTISADPGITLFHLAIYGELFAPDFEHFLSGKETRSLSVETRLTFVKHCIPDPACWFDSQNESNTGPYEQDEQGNLKVWPEQNNIALTWVLRSSRFRPHWKRFRTEVAGCEEFKEGFDDGWWYVPDLGEHEPGGVEAHWRQRLWENICVCQGLEGLGMMREQLQGGWVDRVNEWRRQIAALEKEPQTFRVKRQATLECPFLLGDLRICAAGYVLGT